MLGGIQIHSYYPAICHYERAITYNHASVYYNLASKLITYLSIFRNTHFNAQKLPYYKPFLLWEQNTRIYFAFGIITYYYTMLRSISINIAPIMVTVRGNVAILPVHMYQHVPTTLTFAFQRWRHLMLTLFWWGAAKIIALYDIMRVLIILIMCKQVISGQFANSSWLLMEIHYRHTLYSPYFNFQKTYLYHGDT